MPFWRLVTTAIVCLCVAFTWLASTGFAQETSKVVRADFASKYIDIVPFLGAVESDKPQVSVKLPANGSTPAETMTLQATQDRSIYRWVIFTASNPDQQPRELVIDSARQTFPGSGILSPVYSSSRISAASSNAAVPVHRIATPDRDAFGITLAPASSVTVALELSEVGVSGVRLWQRQAFDHNTYREALYRGIVLGMAVLAVIVITCLVMLSPQIVFPLSMVFAWSSVAFITLETGQLESALKSILPLKVPDTEVLSAVTEALMMTGVALMGVTIMRTRRQLPALSAVFMVAAGAGLALAVYALWQPLLVKPIARIGFASEVVLMLIAAFTLVKRGGVRAKSSLLVWILLGLWTIGAAYVAIDRPASVVASPMLVGGLALVLVALAFVLTYFAFSSTLNPEDSMLAARRNSLALASAAQVVWDYQPGDNTFYVGQELEGLLGYQEGSFENKNPQAWLGLLHPNDHTAYFATIEAARQRGNRQFEQQLRLHHADGRYRWFTLRGSSVADASETGIRLTGVLSDASEQRQSQDRLLSDAIYDVVTGLPNYALYLDRLNQAVSRISAGSGGGLDVIILDIDRFRVVNNRLGQEIGDSLLKTMAKRIESLLPENSSIARMPGDQLAVIHERASSDDHMETTIVLVDKLRHAIARPVRVPPNEIYLTCCAGVAVWNPHMQGADVLHHSAELALFDAKKRGKDKVSFYKPGMRRDSETQGITVDDLQSALQERRFEILYQPIMRLSDKQLAGFEALVRLRLHNGTIIEPASFVPLAERTGLISDIGAYVLGEAARQLGVWQRMFTPAEPVFVSVNVSSAQLTGSRLLQLARTILSREELVPGTLKLEVTETLVMENPELSLQMLERLRAMGIGLSCDDFGTGYSSLSYLRRLPFDTLKIDQSFLHAGLEDERGSVVLDAMILLAHDLGLQVVVEGVETQQQLDHLIALECDLGQGFMIGEPIDAQHVLEALGAPARDTDGSQSGIAALWSRLARKTSEPEEPEPEEPVAEQQPVEEVQEVEPEPEAEALVPWSPYDFHPAPWAPRVASPTPDLSFKIEEDQPPQDVPVVEEITEEPTVLPGTSDEVSATLPDLEFDPPSTAEIEPEELVAEEEQPILEEQHPVEEKTPEPEELPEPADKADAVDEEPADKKPAEKSAAKKAKQPATKRKTAARKKSAARKSPAKKPARKKSSAARKKVKN